jgi:hypothetical protein
MTGEGGQRLPGFDIEDLARLVAARRGQALTVGTEGQVEDPVGVVLDQRQKLASLGLPDTDCPVGAGRGELLNVATELEGKDSVIAVEQGAGSRATAVRLGGPERQASDVIAPACAGTVSPACCAAMSQKRIDLSAPAEARVFPSGEKANVATASLWPSSAARG